MMTLVAHKGCLVALDWQTQKTQKPLLAKISKQAQYVSPNDLTTGVDNANANVNTNANAKVLVHTIKQLNQYFNGQRQAFDIALDLNLMDAFFQQKSMASAVTYCIWADCKLCHARCNNRTANGVSGSCQCQRQKPD